MISNTIDVGIDLGTSNSAVAVAVEGEVEVIRNNENSEITPSVIRFLPNGSVQIGRKAYEHHVLEEDSNSFSGFKRLMGSQGSEYVGAIGRSITPEEMAAELLKSLRIDAEGFLSHPVSAAVITVPAMFELVQSEATQRAAALAAISQAPLLQEPIAAGLAYGYDRDLTEGFYLVYDLGGGTFDAALVRVNEGQLSVVSSEGDNYLGGRDMDRNLATFVGDRLRDAGYNIWEDDDVEGKEFRRRLRLVVEEAKMELSRRQHVDIYFDGSLLDAEEAPIDLTVPVTQAEYEPLINGLIERSAEIVNRLLDQQRLSSSDIAKMLLVGGPTYTPLLRRMVPALTGIAAETRIDPMTIVANGAARFAAGLPVQSTATSHFVTSGLTRLSLSYPTSTSDDIAHVGGRVEDVSANNYSVEIRRSDGGWNSGRVPILGNAFMTTVELLPKRASTFTISCLDGQARPVPVTPDSFTIAHGLMVAEPPLARSIVVAARQADDTVVGRKLLDRGVSLPATARAIFKAAASLSPGEAIDVLNVHVFEGDFGSVELNRHVGFVQIVGTKIDRFLPENTPIEVTVKVDASRRIAVRAYIPLLDETFERVLSKQVMLPVDPEDVRENLERDNARVARLEAVAPSDVARIQQVVDEIEEDLRLAEGGDEERAQRADRRRKELADEIDRLNATFELQLLAQEIEQFLGYTDLVAEECADPIKQRRLFELHSEAGRVVAGGEKQEMERVREEVREHYWAIVWECISWWVGRFIYLSNRVQEEHLTRAVEPLLNRGQAAIHAENLAELRLVCRRLDQALPRRDFGEPYIDPEEVGLRV
jgi:molecular chaperone DnaK